MAKVIALKKSQVNNGTQDSRSVDLTVKDIPVGHIEIRENVRTEYTGIDELADSIRRYGLLQPLTVYPGGEGTYFVKTGHRRFKAWQSLYEKEPDRFHSIRCIVSSVENTAVVQLVENVQRENLTTLDLYQALSTLRNQRLTNQQIAEVLGKSEGHIKNLFVAIHELSITDWLQEYLKSHVNMTFQDVIDTKGITDKAKRLDLLGQRTAGEIGQKALRDKVKALKTGSPEAETPASASDAPLAPPQSRPVAPIRVCLKPLTGPAGIGLYPDPATEEALAALTSGLREFFAKHKGKNNFVST
jgi:ParB family chromosome partitioning protein